MSSLFSTKCLKTLKVTNLANLTFDFMDLIDCRPLTVHPQIFTAAAQIPVIDCIPADAKCCLSD